MVNFSYIKKMREAAITDDELVAIRRDLHMHPEISGHEYKTMERIAGYLDKWQVPYQKGVADTGVVAHLRGDRGGGNIALRADIDALPVTEKNTGIPYCSQNKGAMHACGHDVHTTILLGVVKTLVSLGGNFTGSFTFIFQPDEEDTGGAQRMIAAGCLENPHVDNVIGLHVSPDLPVCRIGIKYGKMYASSDMIKLKVYGKSAHGAHPQQGVDAIIITADILNTLQTIVSRSTSPTDSAVLTFGTIHGGEARNQLAEYVECTGIIRTLDQKMRIATRERVKRISLMVAEAMGGRAELEVIESYNPLITDTDVTDVIRGVAVEQLGADGVYMEPSPQLGVEDFAYFAEERPSGFYHLGCHKHGSDAPLHNSHFDVDEACIGVGVCMQTEIALKLAEKVRR